MILPPPTPPAAAVAAVAADPAAGEIEAFYVVLRDTMKHGKALGAAGRAAKLKPAVEQLFDFPVMAQFAVGPRWAALSPDERRDVTAAMARYTVRSYAHNFDHDGGERLSVEPKVGAHGVDRLVKTVVTPRDGAPSVLSYRMRQSGGAWKVVDVYYASVSQIAAQRSEFSQTLAAGGASALVAQLDKKMLAAP